MRKVGLAALALLVSGMGVAAATTPQKSFAHAIQQESHQPQLPWVILYDQTGNDSGVGIVSQNFEPAFDAYDNQGADDFVVTDATGWSVTEVFAQGVYFNGSGPVNSVNVTFYSNSAGLPGAVACSRPNVVPTVDSAGTLTLDFAACNLAQGTYWVSLQANMDFGVGGEWGWETRTVQANTGAVWQNPGNGFGSGCTTWGNMLTCIPAGEGPDFMFQIVGTVNGGGGTCTDYNLTTSTGVAIVPGSTFVTGSNCDDCTQTVTLPFTFSFFGTPFTQIITGSNGTMAFTTNGDSFTNACLPTASMNNAALPYWDDLYLVNGANGIYTSTSGSAPNRIFNIEWRGQYFPGSGTANFEARLHETTNEIDFVYGTVSNGISSATAGLQEGTGTVVDSLFCNGSGTAVSSGFQAAYTCAGGAACQLTCPANITQPNDPNLCSALVDYSPPTETGQCGQVICTPAAGSTFAVGTTLVTCQEQIPGGPDGPNGTGASCSFDVTVNDTQAPTLTVPAPITVPNDPGLCSAVVNFSTSTTDNCPGPTVACAPASGSAFAVGTTADGCTATDAHGNTTSASFNVTVNDVEPPVIGACPADINDTVLPLQTGKVETFTDPTATDNCSATVGCVPASGSFFAVGNTLDTCTATDPGGNTSSCSFNVDITQLATQEIPALGATGLAMLALLLGAAAVVMLRRRM